MTASSPLHLHECSDQRQLSLDELDEPLHATTFVVVDLETTGSTGTDSITEIGAVKVRGGEIIGEFATLVDPGRADHARSSACSPASPIRWWPPRRRSSTVLPSFLEFVRGSVLVAHNAPFDVGFLKAACAATRPSLAEAAPWWTPRVLARRVLTRDEVPNCKLATLAGLLPRRHHAQPPGAGRRPGHRRRAARADRPGSATSACTRCPSCAPSPPRSATPSGANGTWPIRCRTRPGVYVFADGTGQPLYVGTSKDLRNRVRQYFVASETRTRMGEMVGLAESVDGIVCAHALEAAGPGASADQLAASRATTGDPATAIGRSGSS